MFVNFLAELKRRNVIRIAGAYAVTGWAMFQIVNALFPALMLPGWTVTLFAVLLLMGFPVTLIIAWAFERGPQGVTRTATGEAAGPLPRLGWFDYTLGAAALAIVGVTMWQIAQPSAPAAPTVKASERTVAARDSVAVLPFVAFSGAEEQQFFADGLTEEIINSLAQVNGLKVAGRTSAFHFKGRNEDLRRIGAQLGVSHVIEGSVRQAGNRVRVTAQLIKVADGFHLWSKTFDHDLVDVFAVQTEIAEAVAGALQLNLSAARRPAPHAASPEAVSLALQAKARLRSGRLEDAQAARAMYERLTIIDPKGAAGWAGLGQAVMHLAQDHLVGDFDAAWQSASASIARALAIDPRSVEALKAKGFAYRVRAIRTGNVTFHRVSAAALRRAVELAPKDAEALTFYASALSATGNDRAGLEVLERALAIDPLDRRAQVMRGVVLDNLGRVDEAERQYARAAELFPDSASVLLNLAQLRVQQGDLAAAVAPARRARTIDDDAAASFVLAHIYRNLDMLPEMKATLGELAKSDVAREIAQAILLLAAEDYRALDAYATKQYRASKDPLWADAMALSAMMLGDGERARGIYAEQYPGLFKPEPSSDAAAFDMMTTATAMKMAGDAAQAARVLRLVLEIEPGPGALSGDLVSARLNAHAGLGDVDGAVAELERAYARGFRTRWDFEMFVPLEHYPLMREVATDPRFRALMARIARDNAAQRAQLRAL